MQTIVKIKYHPSKNHPPRRKARKSHHIDFHHTDKMVIKQMPHIEITCYTLKHLLVQPTQRHHTWHVQEILLPTIR